METAQTTADTHILVVGDDDFLLELVVANLPPRLGALMVSGVHPGAAAPGLSTEGVTAACRLVVLALSRSSNEPVVVLAKAGLTSLIGAVPLLIISDRPFAADPARGIFHLSFPFYATSLQQTVAALLTNAISSDLSLPSDLNHRARSAS